MSFYITTPIYYVNAEPHLGHAYATIAADALARFHRARGEDTYFLTGTDEHGQKIEQAAQKQNRPPLEWADAVVAKYRATFEHLNIANDDFIRTTEDRHKQFVGGLWERIVERGDIYEGAYEGHYCVGCEAFYTEAQLDDDKRCPTHQTKAEWVSEPSYFFRMSKYQDALLKHFEDNPGFVRPENYRNEIVSFIKSGLRDLSVSRTTFQWGIPVPGNETHVIYVWMDALSNYMSALGGVDAELYNRFWPAAHHLIGKDILRFHAVYWPCFLLAAGLPLPQSIFVTGWWTVRGSKISKSMPATRVDPNELSDDIGVDALRYFLLREVPLGLDGDFNYEGLVGRYNADLANDLGNLLNRTLTMTGKFCAGQVPERAADIPAPKHTEIDAVARQAIADTTRHLADWAPSRALEAVWTLVRAGNRYVDGCQPWKLAKTAGDNPEHRAELDHCMRTALEALACAARLVAPVMPGKAAELLRQLGVSDERGAELVGAWPEPDRFGQELAAGTAIARGDVLFPRFDKDQQLALLRKWAPDSVPTESAGQSGDKRGDKGKKADKQSKKQGKGQGQGKTKAKDSEKPGLVPFADVARLDLRVAEIRSAEPVPKTSKLLRLSVDLGPMGTRQVVAGIAGRYKAEEVVGKKVILVANLEPATIRGVESQGMILAAGDRDILGLSTIDESVPNGTKVR